MKSIFPDKQYMPDSDQLKIAHGDTFEIWKDIEKFTIEKYPDVKEEWNFGGDKYGSSYRIKDKKRVFVYLLPRDKYFKVAMVFGSKTTDQIMESDISESIKTELMAARTHAEGRGIVG